MVRLCQQWEASAAHKEVLVFNSSSRANLTMARKPATNATTSTRKDDLLLRFYRSWLKATSWPTEETVVGLPVRVLDDDKHQTGRRANTRHGPKWMEEVDVKELKIRPLQNTILRSSYFHYVKELCPYVKEL